MADSDNNWDPSFNDNASRHSNDSDSEDSGVGPIYPLLRQPLVPQVDFPGSPPNQRLRVLPNGLLATLSGLVRSEVQTSSNAPPFGYYKPTLPNFVLWHYFVFEKDDNMSKVEEFEPNHLDRVIALDVNFDATRILTGSVDHKIKIWSRDSDGAKTLIETFTAHDGHIKGAKWLHPTNGNVLATVGDDRRLRIWAENAGQAFNSGHRFQRIVQIDSRSTVPYVSIDTKMVNSTYNFIAVIDRQGLITIFEPTNPDNLKEWAVLDQWQVCVPPNAGEETSFQVRFDPNISSVAYTNSLTDDNDSLGLVATALNEVKIYRAVPSTKITGLAAIGRLTFCQIASIPSHPRIVRDVQWAPMNVRGYDLFGTACRDGTVQIFELHTLPTTNTTEQAQSSTSLSTPRPPPTRAQHQSSLTTAIASRTTASQSVSLDGRQTYKFPYNHRVDRVAKMEAHKDAWSLAWDPNGQVLMSVGSEGSTKMWRRSVVEGEWKLFADQAIVYDEIE